MLCAFISLFSCFFLVVSAEDVACPTGASSGCTCSKISDDLKVECKDNDQITDIPAWIPNNTNRLEFENCDIRILNRDSFKNLVNLTNIEIVKQSRRLTFNDSSVFQGLNRLSKVVFDDNNIASLPAGLFANLPSLETLGLNDNPLPTLPDDLLQNSPNVQTFNLANTKLDKDNITKIGEGHFGKNIQALWISGTYIQRLKDGLFTGLPKLKALSIGNCGINFIGADILKGTELGSITLDGNPIQSIDENAFRGSKVPVFQCNGCQLISSVTFNGFLKKMPALYSINLQNNNLTHVPKNAFTELRDLSIIDLSSNLIATIESNPYGDLPKCGTTTCIQLDNNPFNCDCNLAWLRSFADKIEGDKTSWKCVGPPSVAGKSLLSLEINAFCCGSVNSTKCGLPQPATQPTLQPTTRPTTQSDPDPNNGWIVSADGMMVAILSQIVIMFSIP
ncbi:leucine-rich repeat-containing 15 [Paramuricea clavata]|nr:leucine-rich repeat-containing 15 [Paramuricea clavata]